jgi:hypothetical protein
MFAVIKAAVWGGVGYEMPMLPHTVKGGHQFLMSVDPVDMSFVEMTLDRKSVPWGEVGETKGTKCLVGHTPAHLNPIYKEIQEVKELLEQSLPLSMK